MTQLAPGERWTLSTGGVGGVSVKKWPAKKEGETSTEEGVELAPGERWTLSTGGVGGVDVRRSSAREEEQKEGIMGELKNFIEDQISKGIPK